MRSFKTEYCAWLLDYFICLIFFHHTSRSDISKKNCYEIDHIYKMTLNTILKQNTKWKHNDPLKDIIQIDDGPPMPSSSSTKENTHQDIFLQIQTCLFTNCIQLQASSKVTAYIERRAPISLETFFLGHPVLNYTFSR